LEAEAADGLGDALLLADLGDGRAREGLEALDPDEVAALLRVGVVVLDVELEPGPFAAVLAGRGGGLGDGHVRAQAVQGFEHCGLCLLHARRHGTDHDHQRDAQREAGGDDERRLSAAAQFAPQVGEEHGGKLGAPCDEGISP
jgi:hypothetical protein